MNNKSPTNNWTIKSTFVVDMRSFSKILSVILILSAITVLVYGILGKNSTFMISGGIALLIFLAFTLPSIHCVTVDRSIKTASLRMMIFPIFKFSYPLETVTIKLHSIKSPYSGKEIYSIRWEQSLTNLKGSMLSRGLKPQSLKLLTTLSKEKAEETYNILDALIAPEDCSQANE